MKNLLFAACMLLLFACSKQDVTPTTSDLSQYGLQPESAYADALELSQPEAIQFAQDFHRQTQLNKSARKQWAINVFDWVVFDGRVKAKVSIELKYAYCPITNKFTDVLKLNSHLVGNHKCLKWQLLEENSYCYVLPDSLDWGATGLLTAHLKVNNKYYTMSEHLNMGGMYHTNVITTPINPLAICEPRDTVSVKNVTVFYEYEVPDDDDNY